MVVLAWCLGYADVVAPLAACELWRWSFRSSKLQEDIFPLVKLVEISLHRDYGLRDMSSVLGHGNSVDRCPARVSRMSERYYLLAVGLAQYYCKNT